MVGFSKKRKSSKMRGTREHGRGKKGGRGAGLRGGRGNAGAHKHRRVMFESKLYPDTGYWGKNNIGFKRPDEAIQVEVGINVSDVDEMLPKLVAAGKAQKVGGGYTVDLAALGYDKLLGSGKVRNSMVVKVAKATPGATAKIEEAGGRIEQPGA